MTNKNQLIEELLTKGVENIYPHRKFLAERLKKGKQLTLYLGIDPTGPELHLGHAIPLMKLRAFQELGHHVILLIGNFTALCGDPDKSYTRQRLTTEQIKQNLKNYKKQIGKILDLNGNNPVIFKFNNDWLAKLNLADLIGIASHFTVQQMLVRDLFARRLQAGNPIHLHEFFYPLMQAYDSVAMDVDGEIGGNDQTFNMLAGRDLMMKIKNKEKFVLTTKLLADPTGKKMGKTEGNMITLNDSPQNMFGKVMSWPDEMIVLGFELCTTLSLDEIKTIQSRLQQGENPRHLKSELAKMITAFYHSTSAAEQAETEFNKIFQAKGVPEKIPYIKLKADSYSIVDLIMLAKLAPSKSETKRLIQQGGVSLNQSKITNWQTQLQPHNGDILKVGKRKFVKLKINKN